METPKKPLLSRPVMIGIVITALIFITIVLYFVWLKRKHVELEKIGISSNEIPSIFENVPKTSVKDDGLDKNQKQQRKKERRYEELMEKKKSDRKKEKKANMEPGRRKPAVE
jgi:biopolymer transport protein ExbB/TolQ